MSSDMFVQGFVAPPSFFANSLKTFDGMQLEINVKNYRKKYVTTEACLFQSDLKSKYAAKY